MDIDYNTRDANGQDIIKKVDIKEFPIINVAFDCKVCNSKTNTGVSIRSAVSGNFTDWAYLDDFICPECAKLFSLYFYSYIVDSEGIRLFNLRELREQLTTPQKPPFMFCITTTQKKHLFYKARYNHASNPFAVNLETETIMTTTQRMKQLFNFVEALQTLGAGKQEMSEGNIRYDVLKKVGNKTIAFLLKELSTSREIQIPLHCGQKLNISEEEALCIMDSALKA